MSDAPIIQLAGVSFWYGRNRGRHPVLEDIDLEVRSGDFVGLIGPNGGGKTTLLKVILGRVTPQVGEVRVLGRPPRAASGKVGYVPQASAIDTRVPATVSDVVRTGRLAASPWGFRYGREHAAAAEAAMAEAGVADLANHRIGEISGGQRQRVLIARALASEAAVLLLDEPMAGVDLHMEEGILVTLKRLAARMPIVLVSHDIGFVSAHVSVVACLNRRLVLNEPGQVGKEVIGEMYRDAGPVHLLNHDANCPTRDEHCSGEGCES